MVPLNWWGEPVELREHIKNHFQKITKETVPPMPWEVWTDWAKENYPHENNDNRLKTMRNGEKVERKWYEKVLDPPNL